MADSLYYTVIMWDNRTQSVQDAHFPQMIGMQSAFWLYYQINDQMSMFESGQSSFTAQEETRSLVTRKDKENRMDPRILESCKAKESAIHVERIHVMYSHEKEELSFRARGLETQVFELKSVELRLKDQLRGQKSQKEELRSQLQQTKQQLNTLQRVESQGGDLTKRLRLQLTERNREIQATRQELNSERLRGRIDCQKQKRRSEELEEVRRQVSTLRAQIQQGKVAEKQLQHKLCETVRTVVQLKFQKNTLLQQLKYYKLEKEAIQSSSSQEKCEQLISVTRQLNQMSLECAKWRTQWQELRSEQEHLKNQTAEHLGVRQELQRSVSHLKQIIQQKKQDSNLCEGEMMKAKAEVAKIQEAERTRREEMAKKDRYVLKLEAESKKFEAECQLRVKQLETSYEMKMHTLREEKNRAQRQLDQTNTEHAMRHSHLEELRSEKLVLCREVEEQKQERVRLTSLNTSSAQQIAQLNLRLTTLQATRARLTKCTQQLSSEIDLKNQQMEQSRKARRDLQLKHERQIQLVGKQTMQSVHCQLSMMSSQLSSKHQELLSMHQQNQLLQRNIQECGKQFQSIKAQREEEFKRFRAERQRMKRDLDQAQIRLRVCQSESAGMQQIMNDQMSKRNQVIQQLVREVRQKRH